MDKHQGEGGQYTRDPKSGARVRVAESTRPHPQGGARDAQGRLIEQPRGAPEPALPAPAPESGTPAAAAAPAPPEPPQKGG